MNNKFWCYYQEEDCEGVYCTAHLVEDRVFNCLYWNNKESLKSQFMKYKCDYTAIEDKMDESN